MSTFEDVMGVPAWKSHPSWYLVATNDEAIPPDAERMFARRMGAKMIEVPSSHLAMVSHPAEELRLIEAAANVAAVKQIGEEPMPMIDVHATAGTFANPKALARDLASTLMKIEQVPDIPMFRNNTAAFIHDLPDGALSNVEGDGNYVRVQVLTNAGALNREKQIAVVRQFTDLVAVAAGDPSLTARTWVLLTEAIEGGWGLAGRANTNAELVDAARAQIAELQRAKGPGG